MRTAETFWSSCFGYFSKELSSQQFNTWIKPLRLDLSNSTPDQIVITAPNRFVQQWVKENFLSTIQNLAETHFSKVVKFQLNLADPQNTKNEEVTKENETNEILPTIIKKQKSEGVLKEKGLGQQNTSRLNPTFTFDSFVTGKANQLARAAAIQVAEFPGTAYNPLFIYGGVGLGKTHLIQAIGNLVLSQKKEAKVRYIHAEQYVSDVVRAYQHKAFDEFKRYYHSLDLLLVDDIQFIGGKNRTQEEFFYAFNALVEAHKQVIITCDSYPKEISGMEERLVSRFGWGLTVAVEPPELEMRVAILLKKALLEKITLDENIAFFIAKHIRSNVRELEGALKRVLAYSRFTGLPLSLELTRESLKDLLAVQNRQISIENIQKTVADY